MNGKADDGQNRHRNETPADQARIERIWNASQTKLTFGHVERGEDDDDENGGTNELPGDNPNIPEPFWSRSDHALDVVDESIGTYRIFEIVR